MSEQEVAVYIRFSAVCLSEDGPQLLADARHKVRSFSPKEEKHSSTLCSDTSSRVDGFHLGLWSLSTSTENTQTYKRPVRSDEGEIL